MDIYSILCSKPHNVHYLNRYYKFITSCQKNNMFFNDDYVEKHHICPKSRGLFPQYASFKENPWNKVVLSARQHYIAHLILSRVYRNIGAEVFLIYRRSDNINTSRKYEYVKQYTAKKVSEQMKTFFRENGHPRGMLGKTHSEDYKAHLKRIMKGAGNPMFGRKQPSLSAMNKDPHFIKENTKRSVKTKKHKKAVELGFKNYEELLVSYRNTIEVELKDQLLTIKSERKRLLYICELKNISMKKLDGILRDLNIKLTNHYIASLQL